MARELEYTVHQRREGATLSDGKYYYLVTTVVSGVQDKSSGIPIVTTGPGDEPLLSLFLLDAQSASALTDLFVEDTLTPSRVATPEDFFTEGALVGGEPWLNLCRLFFPSDTVTNPTTGTAPIAPDILQLGDVSAVSPTGGVTCVPPDCSYYACNFRIDAYKTVVDADLAATALRNALSVFKVRYNEMAASFGTADPGDTYNYREYDI